MLTVLLSVNQENFQFQAACGISAIVARPDLTERPWLSGYRSLVFFMDDSCESIELSTIKVVTTAENRAQVKPKNASKTSFACGIRDVYERDSKTSQRPSSGNPHGIWIYGSYGTDMDRMRRTWVFAVRGAHRLGWIKIDLTDEKRQAFTAARLSFPPRREMRLHLYDRRGSIGLPSARCCWALVNAPSQAKRCPTTFHE
ncbi:hypothetical protein C8J56DRAFT_888573 [Mycena floridula]|nr:hypothetical protein C8J56DRAFT_888573 [Mycena floridula]